MSSLRPQLKPALRRLWRDGSTLQIGVDPRSAVVISGLDGPAARLVELLDGTRDRSRLLTAAVGLGIDPARVDELLVLLDGSGVLDDASGDRHELVRLNEQERARLAPDLASASLLSDDRDGGASVLGRRRASVVAVRGAGRVGASVASLLAAAGVGSVVVDDAGITRPADLAPAGARTDDVGSRRRDAAIRAARRVAPGVRTAPTRGRRADVVVLAPVADGDGDMPDRLLRRGVTHLFAQVRDATGVVGPLVLPGRSSCRRCHDLHRADRDPGWPSVAAQLTDATRNQDAACDVVLATAVAAQAAIQVLAFLDGHPAPAAVDGTIEIGQPYGRVRRRGWTMHPLCGCGWDRR